MSDPQANATLFAVGNVLASMLSCGESVGRTYGVSVFSRAKQASLSLARLMPPFNSQASNNAHPHSQCLTHDTQISGAKQREKEALFCFCCYFPLQLNLHLSHSTFLLSLPSLDRIEFTLIFFLLLRLSGVVKIVSSIR